MIIMILYKNVIIGEQLPLITLRKGQPLYKEHLQYPQKYICNAFSTFEKRTASLQGTKWMVPKCPLLRGSTI